MFNRDKTKKLILYTSPLGTLVATSILFGHPVSFYRPAPPPIQLASLETGATEFSAPKAALIQPAAIDKAATSGNAALDVSPTPNFAGLPFVPFEDGYPEPAIANPATAKTDAPAEGAESKTKSAAIELPKTGVKPALSNGSPLYTAIVEDAKAPKGWSEFCNRYPGECSAKTATPREITLTTDAWDTIVGVNNWANQNVKPMTDMKHWGKVNKWYYADDGYGDCKDYVLVKQRKLIEAGFPREALLIAIVWTKQNQGHAVLLVRTDKGEFALDNLSKQVRLWSNTPYDYVKRQTRTDSNAWVYIDGDASKPSKMAANDIR